MSRWQLTSTRPPAIPIEIHSVADDWSPYILSATLYLMTRYALKPCTMLASLAVRHLCTLSSLHSYEITPLLMLRLRNLERIWKEISQDAPPLHSAARHTVANSALSAPTRIKHFSVGQDDKTCAHEQQIDSRVEMILCLMTEYILAPSSMLALRISRSLAIVAQCNVPVAEGVQATACSLIRHWQSLIAVAITPIPFNIRT